MPRGTGTRNRIEVELREGFSGSNHSPWTLHYLKQRADILPITSDDKLRSFEEKLLEHRLIDMPVNPPQAGVDNLRQR